MSGDYRVPSPAGANALPAWRRNPGYANVALSPESIALLDDSEAQEKLMAERLRERTQANRAAIEASNAQTNARHVEQLRTDLLSDGELREELEDAIHDLTLAQRKVGDAELVVQRANTSVAEAQGRLALYADIDKRVAAYHVERIRNGANCDALPSVLVEAKRDQREAADALTAMQSAYVALATEFQVAQENMEAMAQARDQAAVAIVSRHCAKIASDIEATLQRLYDLRGQLLSITSVWIPLAGVQGPVPVNDRVREALRRGDERPLVNEGLKAQARDWFTRLQTDATATIGG